MSDKIKVTKARVGWYKMEIEGVPHKNHPCLLLTVDGEEIPIALFFDPALAAIYDGYANYLADLAGVRGPEIENFNPFLVQSECHEAEQAALDAAKDVKP